MAKYSFTDIQEAWIAYKTIPIRRVLVMGKWVIQLKSFGDNIKATRAEMTKPDRIMSFPTYLKEYHGRI